MGRADAEGDRSFLEWPPNMSLALSTLIYEWRRYLAAVMALALAGVLMLALSGLFVGLLSSFTAVIDRSRGQLIIMMADATSMAGPSSGLPARVLPLIYRHPDVVEVRDLPGDFGRFLGPGETEPKMVNIMIVDTAPDSVTLPIDFSESLRTSLSVPFNIAVDTSALRQLGVEVGDEASLNGRTVRVAALLTNYPNMQAPNIVMSRQTHRLMAAVNDSQIGQLMPEFNDLAEKLNQKSGLTIRSLIGLLNREQVNTNIYDFFLSLKTNHATSISIKNCCYC